MQRTPRAVLAMVFAASGCQLAVEFDRSRLGEQPADAGTADDASPDGGVDASPASSGYAADATSEAGDRADDAAPTEERLGD